MVHDLNNLLSIRKPGTKSILSTIVILFLIGLPPLFNLPNKNKPMNAIIITKLLNNNKNKYENLLVIKEAFKKENIEIGKETVNEYIKEKIRKLGYDTRKEKANKLELYKNHKDIGESNFTEYIELKLYEKLMKRLYPKIDSINIEELLKGELPKLINVEFYTRPLDLESIPVTKEETHTVVNELIRNESNLIIKGSKVGLIIKGSEANLKKINRGTFRLIDIDTRNIEILRDRFKDLGLEIEVLNSSSDPRVNLFSNENVVCIKGEGDCYLGVIQREEKEFNDHNNEKYSNLIRDLSKLEKWKLMEELNLNELLIAQGEKDIFTGFNKSIFTVSSSDDIYFNLLGLSSREYRVVSYQGQLGIARVIGTTGKRHLHDLIFNTEMLQIDQLKLEYIIKMLKEYAVGNIIEVNIDSFKKKG